ncbi:MAG: hypothetical protein D6698_06795 [Gammaproteobacteria bacterium]|nr:MAG: hypothetical protein D6698_06795 [Gammaproteobacteria bacterium]
MVGRLDYNGKIEFFRKRTLVEPTVPKKAPKPEPDGGPLQEEITRLYDSLALTFLKGEGLKTGLKEINPAEEIPVLDSNVSAALRRLGYPGEVITFKTYTEIVDYLADQQWRLRRIYDRVEIPPDFQSQSSLVYDKQGRGKDLISRFLTGDGVAGALIMMLSTTLFQIPGFSLLALEQGAKGYFVAQVPLALAILVELGIKMARIKELLEIPGIENYDDLETNTEKRRKILAEAGIDYEEVKKGTRFEDAKLVVTYVRNYIAGFTEDVRYDHWIAYGTVIAHQNLLRAAIDTSTLYSKQYQTDFGSAPFLASGKPSKYLEDKDLSLSPKLASHLVVLRDRSDSTFNDIYNIFSDIPLRIDYCCLLQILEGIDTDSLYIMGKALKLLSVDLQGELIELQDAFYSMITNMLSAAAYNLASELTISVDKLLLSVMEKFAEAEKRLGQINTNCPSLMDIGLAIGLSIESLKGRVDEVLAEVQSQILSLNRPQNRTLVILGDRRYLFTLGKLLDFLAVNLEAAKSCEGPKPVSGFGLADDGLETVLTMPVLKSQPKYFDNIQPTASRVFPGRRYGPSVPAEDNDIRKAASHIREAFR